MSTSSDTQRRFLTIDQLCEYWSINRSTVYRFRKAGMPAVRAGKLVRFDRDVVDQWFLDQAEVAS